MAHAPPCGPVYNASVGIRGCVVAHPARPRSAASAIATGKRASLVAQRRRQPLAHCSVVLAEGLDVEATATLLVVQVYGLNVLAKTGATAEELQGAVEVLLAGLG